MYNKRNPKKLALKLSPQQPKQVEEDSFKTYYKQGPVCILPNLYLGAHHNANNFDQISTLGINCIINVASELPHHQEPIVGVHYHHQPWKHRQSNLAQSEFDKAIKVVLEAHRQEQIVLIHCQQGIERSAALVLAFLLYSSRHCTDQQAWSLDRALKFVQDKAPIRPNMDLVYQLREYEFCFHQNSQKKNTTRIRRSESIGTSHDKTNKITIQNRPRSQSCRETINYSIIQPSSKKSISIQYKHIIAITSLLILLTALQIHFFPYLSSYQHHENITSHLYLNQLFNKPVYII